MVIGAEETGVHSALQADMAWPGRPSWIQLSARMHTPAVSHLTSACWQDSAGCGLAGEAFTTPHRCPHSRVEAMGAEEWNFGGSQPAWLGLTPLLGLLSTGRHEVFMVPSGQDATCSVGLWSSMQPCSVPQPRFPENRCRGLRRSNWHTEGPLSNPSHRQWVHAASCGEHILTRSSTASVWTHLFSLAVLILQIYCSE